MYPILFRWGMFTVHTYGALVAGAILLGWWLLKVRMAGRALPAGALGDLVLAGVFGGIVGARLYYVGFTAPEWFLRNPLELVAIWHGGLAVHGGWIGGGLTVWYLLRRLKIPAWRFADAAAPALALGQAVGRLGCFAAGCCFGMPTDAPWAVTFRHPESLAPLGIALHPTQLYESGLLLLLGFGLMAADRVSRVRRCDGAVFLLFCVVSSVMRVYVEGLRWDSLLVWGTSLKAAQLVAAVAAAAASWLLWARCRAMRTRPPGKD